jgi:multidrug efflux system outer membrane protein
MLLLLAADFVLTGCNLAPNYVRPASPVPERWPEGANSQGVRRAAEQDLASFYPDARLRALIAAALENNRDLRVATARVAEAQALYGIQRADRLPTFSGVADRSASLTPADLSLTGSPLSLQRYDVNVGLSAFELDFWGRVKNLSAAALANYLSTEEARRAFRLSVISDVADAYWSRQELDERTVLARDTVKTRSETRDLIGRRREVGIASDLDYSSADGSLQSARAELANLERQRAAAGNFLRLLVGTEPANLPPATQLSEQAGVPELAADLPADILLRRPDVLAAEQQLLAANANIGAARAAFLPRITLTGAFGTASAEMSGLFENGSKAWNFLPMLTQPLFDFGRTTGGLDLAEARKNIAVAQYEKAIQQAFREVADLLAAREKLKQQLDAQEANERAQDERLRLTEARYNAGVASYLEFLDAQRDSFTARQATIQVRRQSLSAASQLYKALGGGS